MQVVDIADMLVSGNTQDVLVTHSLGSCIGMAIWDPEAHVGGMIHYMLPSSTIAPEKARAKPAMFADTGIPAMFRAAYELGAIKSRIIVKVAGGSSLLDSKGMFNIGKRNYIALRRILWENGILIESEDVGGAHSRTMRLSVADGRVTVKKHDGEVEL